MKITPHTVSYCPCSLCSPMKSFDIFPTDRVDAQVFKGVFIFFFQ